MALRIFLPPIRGVLKGIDSADAAPNFSEHMNNMRPVSTLNNKIIICQRPALDKWGNGDQIGAAEQPVVALCVVSAVV
jgi:hypothetical protein